MESSEVSDMRALVFGDQAVVNGTTVTKGTTKGLYSAGTYRWTDIFQKRDGRWWPVSSYSTKATKNLGL